MCVRVCVCIYVCVRVGMLAFERKCMCEFVRVYVCARVCMCAGVCVSMFVCV